MQRAFRQLALTGAVAATFACAPSVQQEIAMGDQYAAEIERTMPMLTDGRAVSAFNASVSPLERVARRDLDWEFRIVNSDQVNAFAVPGGHVYVFRGLIERAAHYDEFAGALAHEIAHVDLRHSAEQMGNVGAANMGLTLAYVLLGRQPGNVEALAVNLAGGAVFAKFSRDHEREADSMAVAYLTEARIDPTGLTNMFRRLQQLQQREPSKVELWFSSHPMPEERIDNTGRYINTTPGASAMVRNGRSDLDAFRTLQARLRALPDAPRDVQAN